MTGIRKGQAREDEQGAGAMVPLRYLTFCGVSLGSTWLSPGLRHGGVHGVAAKGKRVPLPPPALPLPPTMSACPILGLGLLLRLL